MSTPPFNPNLHKLEIQNVQNAQSALDSAIANDLSNILTTIKNLQADFEARINILTGLPGFPDSFKNDLSNIAATYSSLEGTLPNYVSINAARQTFDNSVNKFISDLLPPPPPPPPAPQSSGLSSGAIAGIVIGSLLGVALIAGAVYYFYYKKNSFKPSSRTEYNESPKYDNPIDIQEEYYKFKRSKNSDRRR
jgi:hypothetical protein